jgi:EAL domain-containing protein (putative c-di-GMP-specific phosphodiesterase class I)
LALAASWAVGFFLGGANLAAPHWFYLPVLFAASRFGHLGAGIAAVGATLLAGPLMLADVTAGISQAPADYLSRGIGFLVIGQVTALILRRQHRAESFRDLSEDATRALRIRLEPYDRKERRALRDRRQVEGVLREGTMSMEFQPIVDLETGRVVAVEALARFPGEPAQPPNVWFTQAWEVGLGVELEMAALRLAIQHLEIVPAHLPVAVNLSPRALTTEACSAVLAEADRTRLIVEVTEHMPIERYDELLEPLNRFRMAGGRVAVDDLGAGFASLRHMLLLFPDMVKLDVEFVRGIDHDPGRRVVAAALTESAHKLNAKVVAEGIETVGELEAVRRIGVDQGQGYFLGWPVPVADLRFDTLALTGS